METIVIGFVAGMFLVLIGLVAFIGYLLYSGYRGKSTRRGKRSFLDAIDFGNSSSGFDLFDD